MTEALTARAGIALHWFRRDLRLADNAALSRALRSGLPVVCLFVFDEAILAPLPRTDPRVAFIQAAVGRMRDELHMRGCPLLVELGKPPEVLARLAAELPVRTVFANRDYEPYAIARDREVARALGPARVELVLCKDHLVFEPVEVRRADAGPFSVFTPYFRRWRVELEKAALESTGSERLLDALQQGPPRSMPSLAELGFEAPRIPVPEVAPRIDTEVIARYETKRDRPDLPGTTKLGVHLRFGTLGIRELMRAARDKSEVFLSELAWRDFFAMILFEFPHTVDQSFRPAYASVQWRDAEEDFQAWREGRTGYPLVDAGMRELAATGFMHNRVRMVTAGFLCKHLLIDWRRGERYFAEKLFDFELASNVGNWQWAAGTGCDAAPYFRIFNPSEQARRFDPDGAYVRRWLTEEDLRRAPIVEHRFARERCLAEYRRALGRV